MLISRLLAAVLLSTLTACAAAVTDSVADAKASQGIPYYLPTAEVTLNVTAGFTNSATQKKLTHLRGEIGAAEAVADTSSRYVLRYNPNVFGDDHFCVTLTQSGLLDTVQLVAADRTTDIVVNVAKSVLAFSTITSGVPVGQVQPLVGGASTNVEWDSEPFLTLKFDPTEDLRTVHNEIEFAYDRLVAELRSSHQQQAGVTFSVGSQLATARSTPAINLIDISVSGNAKPATNPFSTARAQSGFLVRPLGRAKIKIAPVSGPVTRTSAYIPSRGATTNVELQRSFGVAKHYAVKLQNGNVSSYEVNKSSEALAASKLPLDIANAILNVPVEVFQGMGRIFQSEADMIQALSNAELQKSLAERVRAGDAVKVNNNGDLGSDSQSITLAASDSTLSLFGSGMKCRVVQKTTPET